MNSIKTPLLFFSFHLFKRTLPTLPFCLTLSFHPNQIHHLNTVVSYQTSMMFSSAEHRGYIIIYIKECFSCFCYYESQWIPKMFKLSSQTDMYASIYKSKHKRTRTPTNMATSNLSCCMHALIWEWIKAYISVSVKVIVTSEDCGSISHYLYFDFGDERSVRLTYNMDKTAETIFKISSFVFNRRKEKNKFGTTRGWVNDDNIFISRWKLCFQARKSHENFKLICFQTKIYGKSIHLWNMLVNFIIHRSNMQIFCQNQLYSLWTLIN